jgi:hypothetical protein
MNKTIAARKAVYRWLYERRIHEPGVYFSPDEIKDAAAEPHLAAALAFGQEMHHLEKKRGSWRMTAFGMMHAEGEGYVEGEE